jgi:hypothetical protein
LITTLGAHPDRVDLTVHAGERIDFSIPVLDADGAAVTSLAGWDPAAQVRAAPGGNVLATFATSIEGVTVRVTATSADTAAWAWPVSSAQWDLVLTSPDGVPYILCAGWVRLYPTITR